MLKEQPSKMIVIEHKSREKHESNNKNKQKKRKYLEMIFQAQMIY